MCVCVCVCVCVRVCVCTCTFVCARVLCVRMQHMIHTSCLPPLQASDSEVSLVRSDMASMLAPWSSNMETVIAWPALAASMSGEQPKQRSL